MAEERRHISQLNLLSNPAPDDELLAQDKSEGTGAGADAYKRLPLSAVALLGTAQTWTAAQTFSQSVVAASVRSGDFVLSDDTATAITPPRPNGAMLTFYGTTGGGLRGEMALWAFRAVTGAVTNIVSGSNADVVNSTVLTGTTGADGKFTYSCSGGQVYVENRLGQTVNLQYLFFG